jgi:hypothetical protein
LSPTEKPPTEIQVLKSRLELAPAHTPCGQRTARSAFPALTARSGLAGTGPAMLLAAHESRREILGSQSDFCRRRWHPAKTTGVLRIASSVLHILSQTASRLTSVAAAALVIGRKAAQKRFSEENFRTLLLFYLFYITGNAFLNSSAASIRTTPRNSRHTTSLDELAELNNYSNWGETSSTHLFASHS